MDRLHADGGERLCAAVRLSPLGVCTPAGENPVEKGDEPRGEQHVERSASGVSIAPQWLISTWVMRRWRGAEGDKERLSPA
jgi:hypothetical protein